jgi:hypothetical protein
MKKLLWFLCVLAMLVITGCGSNYKEYYQKVHEDLLLKQIAPLHDEFLQTLNDAMDITPTDDASMKSKYDEIAKKLGGIIEELKKNSPPEDFKNPHKKLEDYLNRLQESVNYAQKAASGDVNAGKAARNAFKDQMVKCPKCGAENYIDKESYTTCSSCKADLTGGYEALGLSSQLKLIDDEFYGKKTILDNK